MCNDFGNVATECDTCKQLCAICAICARTTRETNATKATNATSATSATSAKDGNKCDAETLRRVRHGERWSSSVQLPSQLSRTGLVLAAVPEDQYNEGVKAVPQDVAAYCTALESRAPITSRNACL